MMEHTSFNVTPGMEHKLLQVRVSLLDNLLNLSGELVLSRNQLIQGVGVTDMQAIELSSQRIDMITSELQETVMRTRMQHISTLFFPLEKTALELGQKKGKKIDVAIEGHEVELDKSVLESIRLPLTRLVESLVNESIEMPEKREVSGKPPEALLRLRASQDAGQINILVEDDGRPREFEKIPWESLNEIETLGGTIENDSVQSEGNRLRIKLPLTLAIIPTQVIAVGNETFAIPQSNLSELIRIPAKDIKNKIEIVGDAEVIRLRGDILPLVNLHKMFGISKTYIDPESGELVADRRTAVADRRSKKYSDDGILISKEPASSGGEYQDRQAKDRRSNASHTLNVCVVFAGEYKYGLIIDRFLDSEEIVVKPLGVHFKDIESFIGATILGDGKAALILDILNIAQQARLSNKTGTSQLKESITKTENMGEKTESLVIFRNKETEYFAASLDAVDRIERVALGDIEQIGENRVLQYRGGALPIVELSDFIDVDKIPEKALLEVIVLKTKGKKFGLLVTPPIDTLEVCVGIDDTIFTEKGIKGSMIINGHTTLLLNLDCILNGKI